MKPRIQRLIGTIGALCLGWTMIFQWDGVCLLFFGEIPFPEKEE